MYWPLPREAGFLAGKMNGKYKRNGGTRGTPLPDLFASRSFMGAHAMVLGCRVLTRDVRRFKACFPLLELIAPE
jgi:hypothetical protein